jgi:hypothetical protein
MTALTRPDTAARHGPATSSPTVISDGPVMALTMASTVTVITAIATARGV